MHQEIHEERPDALPLGGTRVTLESFKAALNCLE